MVEMIHAGAGTLVCCNRNMTLQQEGVTDGATEKHVPVVEKIDAGYKVTVGSVDHPMEKKHYIEWIELIADGRAHRQFLEPGEPPVAVFMMAAETVSAREYCNLHGLWEA
jgi:superoxide reductase